jgi:hypothetical protein
MNNDEMSLTSFHKLLYSKIIKGVTIDDNNTWIISSITVFISLGLGNISFEV